MSDRTWEPHSPSSLANSHSRAGRPRSRSIFVSAWRCKGGRGPRVKSPSSRTFGQKHHGFGVCWVGAMRINSAVRKARTILVLGGQSAPWVETSWESVKESTWRSCTCLGTLLFPKHRSSLLVIHETVKYTVNRLSTMQKMFGRRFFQGRLDGWQAQRSDPQPYGAIVVCLFAVLLQLARHTIMKPWVSHCYCRASYITALGLSDRQA